MKLAGHPLYRADLEAAADWPGLEALRGATVLVTGATGLIGACLTDALAWANRTRGLGVRVIALCRNGGRARERFDGADGVSVAQADLAGDCGELPAADFVVHAASNAHPMAFSTDPVGTMRANLLGTMRLLERMRAGGRRLLFVSTGEIYGENPAVTDGFREEDFGRIDPMNPRSCYPESKRAAETLCASYVQQYGLDCVVARLCYIYGPTVAPGNTRADAQFLKKALAGEDIVLKSDGAQLRSYCYVADAVRGLLAVLLSGARGEAYNVAARGGAHTIREYAETLARLAGVRVAFDLPPEAERRGYSAVTRAVQNPAKLEALGWSARVPLEEGLSHTLQILRPSQRQ